MTTAHNGLPDNYEISLQHVAELLWRVGDNEDIPSDLSFFVYALGVFYAQKSQ